MRRKFNPSGLRCVLCRRLPPAGPPARAPTRANTHKRCACGFWCARYSLPTVHSVLPTSSLSALSLTNYSTSTGGYLLWLLTSRATKRVDPTGIVLLGPIILNTSCISIKDIGIFFSIRSRTMFRYNTSTTPTSAAGRRSTRAARGSSKRRRSDGSRRGGGGGDGGLKRKFEEAAQRPAKKWVKVWRPPASAISFKVATWVPLSTLTEEERLEHEAKIEQEAQLKHQQQLEAEKEARPQEDDKGDEPLNDAPTSEHVEQGQGASQSRNLSEQGGDVIMSDQRTSSPNRPMEVPASRGDAEEPNAKRAKIQELPTEKIASDNSAIVATPQDQPSTIPQPTQRVEEAHISSETTLAPQSS